MLRKQIFERPDWRSQAESLGFQFHTFDGEIYWDEGSYIEFNSHEIEVIENATEELHGMSMNLVDEVIQSEQMLEQLGIPRGFWDYIAATWKAEHPHLYGRMDLSYSTNCTPRLLELNYDTPTSLYESAYYQWIWFEDHLKLGSLPRGADQFNSIQETLIEALTDLRPFLPGKLYFSSVHESTEDRGTVDYLRDCAIQAGIETEWIAIQDIGLNEIGQFGDLSNELISSIFKLYPWEHLLIEKFGTAIPNSGTLWIEPAWKSILSNKGILPLLWAKYPNHPNLLASFAMNQGETLKKGWVQKPYFSREGANIRALSPNGIEHFIDGPYDGPQIRQAWSPLPDLGGGSLLTGSWVIADRPCGIGMREDQGLITRDTARFLPHLFVD